MGLGYKASSPNRSSYDRPSPRLSGSVFSDSLGKGARFGAMIGNLCLA